MNVVTLIGRLTKDVDTRQNGEMLIARYTLAVDRRGKKQDDKPNADFISCVCFGKTAEFAERYLYKGIKIAINGHIQTGSYVNKDGVKIYTTDVVVDNHEFCEKREGGAEINTGFENVDEGSLPFE